MTNHGGVVRGQVVSRETTNQMPRGVALSDLHVVILTAGATLQVEVTKKNTKIIDNVLIKKNKIHNKKIK